MILVSFPSVEDALTNDVNKYDTFSSQGTENPPFRNFWDARYREYPHKYRKAASDADTYSRRHINTCRPDKHFIRFLAEFDFCE